MLKIWAAILLLAVYQTAFTDYFLTNPDFYQLDGYTWESEAFRCLRTGEVMTAYLQENPTEEGFACLTALMAAGDFDLRTMNKEEWEKWPVLRASLLRRKPVEYRKLKNAYQMLYQDIACFPVPEIFSAGGEPVPDITYSDSFLERRTYGGERQHEGCDLMGNRMPRGFYPVLSMTGGVVEQAGWLEKGGWRIGIRAPSGAYFYYAHLYGYAEEWNAGDPVEPGTLLGYMGDSGYGILEGTVGNFEVHLHLGVYLSTDHEPELSVNPYWLLKYSERFRRRVTYNFTLPISGVP